MKKTKFMALVGIASLLIPFSVSAEKAEEISNTGTSNIDATVNSVELQNSGEEQGYFYVTWGDFKFNYSYDANTGTSSWTPVTEAGDREVDGILATWPASNEVNVNNGNMKKDMRATLSFASNITGVSAQVFGEKINPKAGEVETALQQLPNGSIIVNNDREVDFDVNLLGGEYEAVNTEYTGNKKIGTFTLTIEDAD